MHELTQSDIVENLFVFVLASFLGLELIRGVSRLLHTPLMSLTNAISSIAIVGSLLITGRGLSSTTTLLGAAAICCSAINAIGGFMITERILRMFKRRDDGGAARGGH
ncbi:MAG TPA: NAD(P) transhydrogenase subunit alpha [Kofleriaceae bacterium]|nr:NAD(P) transhydrogenase subunit alpha [Kofleriaceae bacterium]